jgi:hypothetical protein
MSNHELHDAMTFCDFVTVCFEERASFIYTLISSACFERFVV